MRPVIRWWEIEDEGGWPGHWTRPLMLTFQSVAAYRPPSKRWDWGAGNDWSLRPHP